MNEASRFPAFALGVNKSDLLRFDLIFTEAVEKSCLAIGIDTSIIEEYLHDGGPLEVLPSTDRKQTARLNQLQSNLRFNINHFGWANMEKIQQLLRNEFGTTQVGMEYFHKSFLAQLETLYGRNPIRLRAAVLRVDLKLEGVEPVWRKLIVPTRSTFQKLHRILQHAFEWENCHPHLFTCGKDGKTPLAIIMDDGYMAEYHPEHWVIEDRYTLEEAIGAYGHIEYLYDFGDGWTHTITIEKVIDDYDIPHPQCIDGAGDRPFEDVGGPSGFAEALDVLANPSHPEHESLNRWITMHARPTFDLKQVNLNLKLTGF